MALVFVVEDDNIIRESITVLIEMEGHQVQEAKNGKEALDLLSGCTDLPCLILLDLMMPVMNGIEFRQRQLQNPDIARVPVVVITGRADTRNIAASLSAKILSKPFTADMILGVVCEHCNTHL